VVLGSGRETLPNHDRHATLGTSWPDLAHGFRINEKGQLGVGTLTGPEICDGSPCSESPLPVMNLTGAKSIKCQEDHCCALLSDGSVQCWGDNGSGELGTLTSAVPNTQCSISCSDVPVPVQW
jgi:alpha-tubulin suppressor-like RCC1 family protein